ncbi:hypothetical protein X801_06896 [Opisthorchis viverrini]|uniref:Uncharacterized protein n=1 Tax=Opisthorchis viverrini TaxID=6198 RepID=A0A1S8WS43_OPIVI|nr:hypothetical protein X801_06896 [Opisthorchis viverrini]
MTFIAGLPLLIVFNEHIHPASTAGGRIGYDMWIGILGIQLNKEDMELAWGTAELDVLNEE